MIDDYYSSITARGNCNGKLDSGETAFVLVNLQYPGSAVGMGTLKLIVPEGVRGVTVPTGGAVGYYIRLGGRASDNSWIDFVDVVQSSNRFTTTRVPDRVIAQASFLVTVSTSGTKNLQLEYTPMGGSKVTLPLNLEVGTSASRRNCGDAVGQQRKQVLWQPWNQSS